MFWPEDKHCVANSKFQKRQEGNLSSYPVKNKKKISYSSWFSLNHHFCSANLRALSLETHFPSLDWTASQPNEKFSFVVGYYSSSTYRLLGIFWNTLPEVKDPFLNTESDRQTFIFLFILWGFSRDRSKHILSIVHAWVLSFVFWNFHAFKNSLFPYKKSLSFCLARIIWE